MTLVQTEPKKIYYGEPIIVSDMQGPCPDGFHIPQSSERTNIFNAGESIGAWNLSGDANAKNRKIINYLKLPTPGSRSGSDGSASTSQSNGYYASPIWYDSSNCYVLRIARDNNGLDASSTDRFTNGANIRPFRNEPVVPNSSWTVLYQGTGTAGIYHNPTLGLISISSNGTTRYTIADKNLGATTTFDTWDTTQTAENCGGQFQWGNNYMFPFSGAVTTSTTRVDATNYGPGNYYSDSTFRRRTSSPYSWDTSGNKNLRGGVSQGTTEKGAVKAVYLGENKVRPPFKPAQESIVIKLTANSSGTLYVAKAGYGADGNFGASYKWNISVDDGQSSYYSGSSSNGGVISLSGYTANTDHIVTITPSTESYGWARAFGWRTVSSTYKNLFKEVLYDGSYMGYATSATNTGNRFRASQYYGTALTKAPDEYIPNTVTTIGSDFRADQYYGCTGLLSSPDEYIPNSVTSIGGNFRSEQYYGCSNLISSGEEALPNTVTSIGGSFRQYQYNSCASLENVKGWKDLSIGNSSLYRYRQFYSTKPSGLVVKVLSDVGYASNSNQTLQDYYVSQVQVPSAYLNNFINSTKQPRANITDSKFVGY